VAVPVMNPTASPLMIRATISTPMELATRKIAVLTAAITIAPAMTFLRPTWSLRSPKPSSATSVPMT
jgi:hypothetical protein